MRIIDRVSSVQFVLALLVAFAFVGSASADNTPVRRYLGRGDYTASCQGGDAYFVWNDGASAAYACSTNAWSGAPGFSMNRYILYRNDTAIAYRYSSNLRICGHSDYGTYIVFRVRDLGCN